MSSVNKVTLLGRLGKDPEMRQMNNGGSVANISLATSERWKDQSNETQERTEWHRVVIFGKLAEVAGKYLKKGSQAYFEGRLQTRKWTDQEGKERYSTEVILSGFGSSMVMIGNGDNNGGGGNNSYTNRNQQSSQGGNFNDDEIPF